MFDEPEVIATNSGYPCRYYPTIQDGPVFRWTKSDGEFEVSASRNGVVVSGHSPTLDSHGVLMLTQLLDDAGIIAGLLGMRNPDVENVKSVLKEFEAEETRGYEQDVEEREGNG